MIKLVVCIFLVLSVFDSMVIIGGEKGRREVERGAKVNIFVPQKKESC